MFDTLHAYFYFGISSSLLLILMALFVVGFRAHRSKRSFVILVVSLACWSIADVLELLGPSENWCAYWYGTIRTTAICIVNISWLYFCLDYADLIHTRWGPWLIKSFVAIFGFYAAISWTPWQSLIYDNLEFQRHDWLWAPQLREVGILFYPYLACALTSFLFGLAILCHYVYRSSLTGRRQVVTVVSSFGFLATISFLNGFNLLGNSIIDKTVFVFPVVVMALLTALFRQGFMQSDPILLEALMKHLPDRILVLDEKGYLSEANPAGIEWIQGFARGKTATGMHPVGKESKFRRSAMHQRLVDYVDLKSELGSFVAELPMGRRQLRLTTPQQQQSYAVNVIALESGRRTGTLLTFRDETRMHHTMEDLKTYATTVAHDLKNPLTAIVAYCDLLEDAAETSGKEAIGEFMPPIRESAESMDAIITDLLLIADLERSSESDFTPVDMEELTESVIRHLTQLRPDARVIVEKEHPWPCVLGHPRWLEMIMMNLLSNAMEHSDAEEGSVRISCRCEDEIIFSITNECRRPTTDEVRGEERTETTPRPISHTDPASFTMGDLERPRGFGLSIVRRLVERQGGAFGMDHQGSRMRVWFQLHRANVREASSSVAR